MDDLDKDDDSGIDLEDNVKEGVLSNKISIRETNIQLIRAFEFFDSKIEEELGELDNIKQESYALTNLKNYLLHSFHVGYF